MKLLRLLFWVVRAVVAGVRGSRREKTTSRAWVPAVPCRAPSPWPGVQCSRDRGHDGQHAGRDPDAPRDDWHRSRAWSTPSSEEITAPDTRPHR